MNSTSPSSKPDVNLSLTLKSSDPACRPPCHVDQAALKPEERGILLIQLLLTCAKHTASSNLHHADACLRQISPLASVSGDPMQRLAARFAYALATRLVKRWPGLYKALNHSQPSNKPEVLLDRPFPCLAFAYAIIARTLVHAMSEERVIHIVDLGSGDPNLWASLMQRFVLMGHGSPGPSHLRITCVNSNKAVLERLGTRLVKEAEGLDMPFQFNPLNVSLRELTVDMVKVRSGEALAFVSVLGLHVLLAEDDRVDANFGFGGARGSKGKIGVKDCKQMGQFLEMVKSMAPKVFLLVEQEADHNLNRLVERFVEGLHYYSAMFDSLEGNYGREERVGMEEMFGREIEDIVACEGLEREERHERYARWMVRFGSGGFKPVRLWCDGKQMVEASGKGGYKIVNEKAGVMICWHERPLYAVSAWTC